MYCFLKLVGYMALVFIPQIVHPYEYYNFYSTSGDISSAYTSSDVLEDARLDTVSKVANTFFIILCSIL